MSEISRSAKLFGERYALPTYQTLRRPCAKLDLDATLVHTLPLEPPFPTVEMLLGDDRQPPDAGTTQPWPYGKREQS